MSKLLIALVTTITTLIVGQAQAAPTNESLTIGISAEYETLNPIIANQGATNYMMYLAWRPLIILNLENKWSPLMIKALPTLKNKMLKANGKGLDATIEILAEAKWSDGTPMTCKDVELGWMVGKNPNVSIPSREPYDEITAVTIDEKNPKKCTLSFKTNRYDFLNNFPHVLPSHIEREIFEKFKNESQGYDKNSMYVKNPAAAGLWSGPYVVSEVKLGSHLVFTPNPHFHGKKPAIKRIVFKLIPNNGTLVPNLKAGSIDMIAPAAGLGVDQAIGFDKSIKSENLPYKVDWTSGNAYAHIDLNLDNPILSDIKVRRALMHGFNRQEALQSLIEGRGKIASNFVTERDPWHTDKVKKYEFSRREANKLLDEAGWKKGPDGIRVKDGKRMTLTLMGAAGAKIVEMTEAYLQSQWKDIGAEILIKNEPARVYFGETIKKRNFDMAMYTWISFPENTPRGTLHSKSIPTKENSYTGQNNPGWKNSTVDKLIDELEVELNNDKRKAIGQKIVQLYVEEIPVIPIYYRDNFSVIPKNIKNYRVSGTIFYETLYAENWSL